MSRMILSCVIPVYNAAAHIPELANMLAAQEKGGWEAVFVDDGSTDGSAILLDGIVEAGRFPAKVIHQKNAGVSAARNAGIDASEGDFITFLDADDGISQEYMAVMKKHAAAGREVTVFRHSRVVEGDFVYDVPGEKGKIAPVDILNQFIINPTLFGVYDFLIKADSLRANGTRFPEGFAYYEDYDFILRLFTAAKEIYRAEECIYCYRAAVGSAMSTFNVKRIESLKLFGDGYSQYMEKYPDIREKFEKWFSARIRWSIMWQACVSMGVSKAMDFAECYDMRTSMKHLTGHPDRKVALSARIYLICPYIYICTMAFLGKRRTLIARRKEK